MASRATALRHESFLRHAGFRWLWIALALSAASAGAFYLPGHAGPLPLRHAGGTWFGYITGTIGALLILWLTMLGVRKRAMTEGSWLLKGWVSAHVYLGLALVVVASLHSGFQFGWNVHTLAYVLMLVVVGSGMLGVTAYVFLPRKLSANRGETTQKQMLEILATLDGRLAAAAEPLEHDVAAAVETALKRTRIGGNILQRVTGWHPFCPTRRALRLLDQGHRRDGTLADVYRLLEQKSATLDKARRHIRLRALLQLWLYVHVPATFALLAALTAHIVSVFFYW